MERPCGDCEMMANDDWEAMLEILRERGLSDEDIAGTAYMMFADEQLSLGELRVMLQSIEIDIPDALSELSEEELRRKFRREVLGKESEA